MGSGSIGLVTTNAIVTYIEYIVMLPLMDLCVLTPYYALQSEGGEWPLYVAALHGHLDVMEKLEKVIWPQSLDQCANVACNECNAYMISGPTIPTWLSLVFCTHFGMMYALTYLLIVEWSWCPSGQPHQ